MEMELFFTMFAILLIPMIWGYRKVSLVLGLFFLAYATKAGMLKGMFSHGVDGSMESLMETMIPFSIVLSLGLFVIVRFSQLGRDS